MGWLCFLAGAAAGVVQSLLLWRAARRGPHPLGALLRFLVVSTVLLLCAAQGHVVLATSGWLSAFLIAGLVIARRMR